MKRQTPPNGYLVTKPSPVRPHGWGDEEGIISSLPVPPPPPAQLSLPPAHSNVPGAKGDTMLKYISAHLRRDHTPLRILFSQYILTHCVQPNPSNMGLTGRKVVCVSQDSEAGNSRTARASLVAQMVDSLPPSAESQVRSLRWEDPLEKDMETHSSIPAWRIPWTEDTRRLYSPWGYKESDTTERLTP